MANLPGIRFLLLLVSAFSPLPVMVFHLSHSMAIMPSVVNISAWSTFVVGSQLGVGLFNSYTVFGQRPIGFTNVTCTLL